MSAVGCTAAWPRRSLRERTPTPGSWPSTGTWQAARTAPLPRPSRRRARRCRRVPTRRPSGTTRWPSSWRRGCPERSRPAGGGGAGGELGRGSGPRRRMGGGTRWPESGAASAGRPGPAAGAARALPMGGRRPRVPPSMPPSRRWRCFPDGPPSALRARVLAALATWRMLLGEFAEALPIAVRAVAEAQQAGAVAEHAHGLATLGILQAQRGELDAGMAALRTSFALARRGRQHRGRRPGRDQPHVPAVHGRPLHRGARGGARPGGRPPGPWTRRPR